MIIVFDSETNGLPLNGVPSEDPRHPHVVTLSGVLCEGTEADDAPGAMTYFRALVKPEGWTISPEMTAIHGITQQQAEDFGQPLAEVMAEFIALATRADVMVAHNHHFDHKMLKICCARLGEIGAGYRELLESKSSICTMEAAAQHLLGKKRIKLVDAHAKLCGPWEQKHDGLDDALAAYRVYRKLRELSALPEPKPLTRKVYDTPYRGEAA